MTGLAQYAKFITALLAFAGVLISSGIFTGHAQTVATAVVSAVGAALVYLVPNTPAAPSKGAA